MQISLKEAARRIRIHNEIHQHKEPNNSPIITEILETAAVMFEQIDAGIYKPIIHAHWIKMKHPCGNVNWYNKCSACDCDIDLYDYKYCPNCGAKMDESEDNTNA